MNVQVSEDSVIEHPTSNIESRQGVKKQTSTLGTSNFRHFSALSGLGVYPAKKRRR